MRVYLAILVLVVGIGAYQAYRDAVTDTDPGFVASFPPDSPWHGHEAEVIATMRAEQARAAAAERVELAAASVGREVAEVELGGGGATTRPVGERAARAGATTRAVGR